MSALPTIAFHGAAGTVTGSCSEVEFAGHRLLVDCGLFQGSRSLEELNRRDWTFDPARLDAVLLTHAHIDHSGLLPRLARDGFAGPVYCTAATADLLHEMLPDSGRIQESESERRNRRPDRRDEEPLAPLYTEADAIAACALLSPVVMEDWSAPFPDVRFRFWNAGHILGSASIELEVGGSRLLFSGDLGPEHKAFHPDPSAPVGFDHLFCESTYGDRERADLGMEDRRDLLAAEITGALKRGGNLVIPTFALERTQELLLDLATLINAGTIRHTPIFIDSPLATRLTRVFLRHARELEDLGDTDIFRHPAFHFVETPQQSMALNNMSGAIILAASGMCEAGRVRHHLVHNLPRRESTILFVGFQAAGTLGRKIEEGASRVRISGREVVVRATIRRIDSYSAHADRSELLAWIAGRAPIEGTIFLTHGEMDGLTAIKSALEAAKSSAAVSIAALGERYEIRPGAAARRLNTASPTAREIIRDDWQNDHADFSVQLKRRLRGIADRQARREALARMRHILDDYPKATGLR